MIERPALKKKKGGIKKRKRGMGGLFWLLKNREGGVRRGGGGEWSRQAGEEVQGVNVREGRLGGAVARLCLELS